MKRILFCLLLLPMVAHGTVTNQTISVSFTCTGSVGPFPFTFSISDPTALSVTENGTLLAPSAYTIRPVNNNYDNGGNVTLSTACNVGYPLVLQRNTPITQTSAFHDNMPVPMASFENGLDKLTEITQELDAGKGGTGACGTTTPFVTAVTTNGVTCIPGGGGGGGGGSPPSPPAQSVQLANSTVTGLSSDAAVTVDPTTHTLGVGTNANPGTVKVSGGCTGTCATITSPDGITLQATQNLSVAGTVTSPSYVLTGCPAGQLIKGDGTGCAAGGGGSTPAPPAFALQLANAGVTALAADAAITANTTNHTVQSQSFIGAGPPNLDIRAYGAVCDGSTPIDTALSSAITALPAAGGEILIPGSPNPCYLSNPNSINWGAKAGPVSFNLQGQLRTGTTITIGNSQGINFSGKSAGSTAQFQGPGSTATIYVRNIDNTIAVWFLGTAVAGSLTGTGDPTASLPVTCNNANNGIVYQDTAATNADLWTCASTTGSITAGSNVLTVASVGGIVVGDPICVIGAGLSNACVSNGSGGYFPGPTVLSISGTTLTLSSNATATVSGAATYSTFFLNKFGWRAGGVVTVSPLGGGALSALVPKSAWAIGGDITCTSTSATNSGGKTVATMTGACPIQSGSKVKVAACTPSSANQSGALVVASDRVANTLTWNGGGSATGCTVTGLSTDGIEYVNATSTTSSTMTAVFSRVHPSTDTMALVAVNVNNLNGSSKVFKDINIVSSAGPALWLQQDYLSTYENLGLNTGACQFFNSNGDYVDVPLVVGDSSFITFKGLSIATQCQPYTLHMTQPFNQGYTASGPIYINDSFLISGALRLDHGAAGVFAKNLVFEQATGNMILVDSNHYWNGNQMLMDIKYGGLQDNQSGSLSCLISYETANANPLARAQASVQHSGGNCMLNTYAPLGYGVQLSTEFTGQPDFVNAYQIGVYGTYNNGQIMEGELRGSGANFSPSLIPYASLPVSQDPSTWTASNCTTTTVAGPDGTNTAGQLSCTGITAGANATVTPISPSSGDRIAFGEWINTPTLAHLAAGGGNNTSMVLSNNSNPNWAFTTGLTADTTAYEANIIDDWWHPIVSIATIGTANGSAGNLTVALSGNANAVLQHWKPFAILVPAAVPYKELQRIRTQMLHGCVPSAGATGISYSCYPIQLPSDPTLPLQAATKQYVDNHILGTTDVVQPQATDTFVRSPGALGTNWTGSANVVITTSGQVGNTGGGSTSDVDYYNAVTFGADQCSSAQIVVVPANAAYMTVGVRLGATAGYLGEVFNFIGANVVQFQIWKYSGGVFNGTLVGAFSNNAPTMAIGDVYQLCVKGTTLMGYRNGVKLGSFTDSTFAGPGAPGIGSASTGDAVRYTNFIGSNFGPLTATLGGSALAVGCTTGTAVTLPGANTGMTCLMSGAAGNPANIQPQCAVTATNTVTPALCTAVITTPASQIYNIRVIQ